MDEGEYRIIDVEPADLADRLGDAVSRDLAVEFPIDGWRLIATIARPGGGAVRLVFRKRVDVVAMDAAASVAVAAEATALPSR